MRIRLKRPAETPTSDGAAGPAAPEASGVRVSQRGFLKALAAAGLVGVGEAALAPQVAEASYVNGGTYDYTTNNLVIQGNLVIGPTSSYSATSALAITQAMSGGNLLSGIANTPALTYTAAATTARGLHTKPTFQVNAAVTNLYHLLVDTAGVSVGTGGSIATQYGIAVTAPSGATNNYAVYVAGGTSYLGGSVGIGTTTPTASPPALLAVGTTSQFQVTSSGAIAAGTGITSSGAVTLSGLGAGVVHASSAGVLSSSAVSLASSDVTGVLPIANGGTNNGAGLTPGSVIFFDGTMLNQNNGQLFWDNTNHRLGIGTTGPQGQLHVSNYGQPTFLLGDTSGSAGQKLGRLVYDGGANVPGGGWTFQRMTDAGAFAANLVTVVQSTGNVGIGTTSPAANLDVEGGNVIIGNGYLHTNGNPVYLRASTGDFNDYVKWNSAIDTVDVFGWNGVQLGRNGGGPLVGLRVDPYGNVGVGTTTPGFPLDVLGNQGTGWGQGTMRLSGSNSDVMLHIVNTASGGRDFSIDSAGSGSGLGSGKLHITDVTAQTARLSIDSLGNVGIGTTSPQQNLSVNGGMNADQANGNNGTTASALTFGSGSGEGVASKRTSGGNQYGLDFYTYFTPRLSIANGGNVGVGLTTPSARLSIVASGATELVGTAASALLRSNAGSLGSTAGNELVLASLGFAAGNNSSLGVHAYRTTTGGTDWTTTSIGLGMDVDNTYRAGGAALWLGANGNLGIGTPTPGAALHLNSGSIQISSTKIADSGGCYYA